MEIDRTTEREDENGGMGAGAPDGQGLEDQGNVRLYDGYMGVVRRNREDADRTMRQRTVAAAAALMNIYENPKNGGYSDRSLSDSLSGAFGTPVFGMQRLDGLKGDNEALNGSVALVVPQRGQDGSVTTGVSAMLSPAQQLKILQDARLGDRTAPLQRELWGGLAKRFTPEQLEQQGLRDPDTLFRPKEGGGENGTTLKGGTAARLGASILPQERRGGSMYSTDGKGGSTIVRWDADGNRIEENLGTRAPDYERWRTLRSGYIAEHGADGTVYENVRTGETRFVPNGSAAPQGGAGNEDGAQAPVAGRGGARTARAGAVKPAAQGTAGAKPATEKYSRELLEDINAEIEGLSKNANPTNQDRADLALLRRRKMSLLTGHDLDAEEAAAKANAPDEVRRRQREAVEARFGSFFGGDGNLKGSGFSSFGGKQYLYFRNDDGTTVRAEPGQTVSLNGFPVRWNGGGTGRDSFEIVEPGAAKAEAGEADEGKAKAGEAAGGNTASASSAPDEKAVSAARMRRHEQNAKDASRTEARKDMDGAEQAKAGERAKASKEIRARNAQKAAMEKEKRLKEEKFRAYLADLRRQHGKEDIPEEDAYRMFENDWWRKFKERTGKNLEDMSNYEKLHGKSKTYIPPSGKL